MDKFNITKYIKKFYLAIFFKNIINNKVKFL